MKTLIDTVNKSSGSIQHRDDGIIQVSQSRVRSWRTCKRQHWEKFVHQIKPKRVKRPFQFGRTVHEMLEAFANGDDPFEVLDQIALDKKAMFRAEQEMYGNLIEDVRIIMTEYFEHWPENSMVFLRRDGRAAEWRFEIELFPGVHFTGKFDTVAKAKRMKWLVEHKTFKRKPNDDTRWRSVQGGVYFRANEMLGWFSNVEGLAWDYVRSAPPGSPDILKDGSMSVAKKGLTLPTKARQVIEEAGLRERDYKQFLKDCEGTRDHYFHRVFLPMSRDVVDSIWEDFLVSAQEIAELGETRRERNIGNHCGWCDYEQLCRAAMQGSDVDFLIEREYMAVDEEEHEAYYDAED